MWTPLAIDMNRGRRLLVSVVVACVLIAVCFLEGNRSPADHEPWAAIGWILAVFLSETIAVTSCRLSIDTVVWGGLVFVGSVLALAAVIGEILMISFLFFVAVLFVRLIVGLIGRPRWIRSVVDQTIASPNSERDGTIASARHPMTIAGLLVLTAGFALAFVAGPQVGVRYSNMLAIVSFIAPTVIAWWIGSLLGSMANRRWAQRSCIAVCAVFVCTYLVFIVWDGPPGAREATGIFLMCPLAAADAAVSLHYLARLNNSGAGAARQAAPS